MTPYLFDISRLIARAGAGPMTGIDRVELAYFRELLRRDAPVFFISRMPKSYALLDRAGGENVLDKIEGRTDWGEAGILRHLIPRHSKTQQSAISDLRKLAISTCAYWRLSYCLRDVFPSGVTYVNVGHANLRTEMFEAVKQNTKSRIIVLIHDIIPITYPDLSRQDVSRRFAQDVLRVAQFADLLIYNSQETRQQTERWLTPRLRIPKAIVAHIGSEISAVHGGDFTAASHKPNFICVGTIEPRKNHILLLNIWQRFCTELPQEAVPDLHIVGRRGWNNEQVFKILDQDPMIGRHVFEHKNCDDAQYQMLLTESWGLLFPSIAEGFGLPLIEAAARGVPIICGENAIYHEILGNYPLYLNVDNSYLWSQGILERAGRKRESEVDRKVRGKSVNLPDWQGHFDQIFRFI